MSDDGDASARTALLQRELDTLRVERALIAEQIARHTVPAVARAFADRVPDTVRVKPLRYGPGSERDQPDLVMSMLLALIAIVFVVALVALVHR